MEHVDQDHVLPGNDWSATRYSFLLPWWLSVVKTYRLFSCESIHLSLPWNVLIIYMHFYKTRFMHLCIYIYIYIHVYINIYIYTMSTTNRYISIYTHFYVPKVHVPTDHGIPNSGTSGASGWILQKTLAVHWCKHCSHF